MKSHLRENWGRLKKLDLSWQNGKAGYRVTYFLAKDLLLFKSWSGAKNLSQSWSVEPSTGGCHNLFKARVTAAVRSGGKQRPTDKAAANKEIRAQARVGETWWARQFSDLVQAFSLVSCVAGINPSTAGLRLPDGSLQLEAPGQDSAHRAGTQLSLFVSESSHG